MAKHVVQGGSGGQIMLNSFMLEVSGSLCLCLTKNLFSAHAPSSSYIFKQRDQNLPTHTLLPQCDQNRQVGS